MCGVRYGHLAALLLIDLVRPAAFRLHLARLHSAQASAAASNRNGQSSSATPGAAACGQEKQWQ